MQYQVRAISPLGSTRYLSTWVDSYERAATIAGRINLAPWFLLLIVDTDGNQHIIARD